ncbi:MAG: Crp/Fnr family transcriptional regulator [Cyclobacteriaceae bacterium]
MDAFKNYLQQFPDYTHDAFEKARPFLLEKTLQPGDYFLHHGNVCKSIAFIQTGLLRLYYLSDGKEVTNCFCRENTISTSYKSLVTQQESDIAIQAIEESKLIVLPYESLQMLFNKNLFWQQVGRLAAESEFVVADTHHRLLSDLSASDRYLHVLENDKELLQRVPLHHLATYLQIAHETLSRIRNKIRT